MKKFILILIIAIILIGCKPKEPPEFEFRYEDNVTEEEYIKEGRPAEEPPKEQQAPKEPPKETLPKEGKIEFGGHAKKTFTVIDSPVDLEIDIVGEISYKIDEKNIIKGDGSGTADIKLSSDIGIAKCSGKKKIPITFKITGIYDPKSTKMAYLSHDTKPAKTTLTLECPYEYGGDLEYELEIPIMTFVGEGLEGDVILEHKDGAVIKKKINHPIPDWDANVEVDWTYKISFVSTFDFDVDVDPPVINIDQGAAATPLVTVRLLKGTAKDVGLTVTRWPNINAFIVNPTVTPTETTTLTIETTCDTPPDNYLFTVRGETTGTFRTSVDSVNVIVNKNPTC